MPVNIALCPLPKGCVEGRFLRRVKRFSIEFEHDGKRLWAHTNNSGAMLGLLRTGARALFSPAASAKRKLAWTLERIEVGGAWCGVNTLLPNQMLAAAFAAGQLDFCRGYRNLQREARRSKSRLDACLTGPNLPPLWVECKSATLVEDGRAAFPDAASERARKHLLELIEIVNKGERGAMFYLAQRTDGRCFGPAEYIDAEYARLFHAARAAGVEMFAFNAIFEEAGTRLGAALPIADASLYGM